MDGSKVTILVCGEPSVGKTTFVARCLGLDVARVQEINLSRLQICGREITISVVESPELITRAAVVVIVLFDVTKRETFLMLSETVQNAHRLCPLGFIAIIGTKNDIEEENVVSTQEAESFCHNYQGGSIPYYEIPLDSTDGIQAVFKEILARPLISLHVLEIATVSESNQFIYETMEWAIENNSANILTHLRQLGYAIPSALIVKYQDILAEYLYSEYPLKSMAHCDVIQHSELVSGKEFEDSDLYEYDEPISIVNLRSSTRISETYFLQWSDISLLAFPSTFVTLSSLPHSKITHADLSKNQLTSLPLELFQLNALISLNVSHNFLTSIPSPERWGKTSLQIFDISHNSLSNDSSESSYRKVAVDYNMFPALWYIDLKSNSLTSCPPWLFMFAFVSHLDLRRNQITHLPKELSNLTRLHTLLIQDLPIVDPPPPLPSLSTQTLLSYLRFKQASSQPLDAMRVVIVGPQNAGKTSLVCRLRGESNMKVSPTKGLEVVEWKYKGEVLRKHLVTFDLWDFSGHPDFTSVYSCFNCHNSLHIGVFNIAEETDEIIRWLSDIQSLSPLHRVPVILVFTHMDKFETREEKEKDRRLMTQWIKYNATINDKVDTSPAFTLLSSTMSVKSIQGEFNHDRVSLYEPPQLAFDMQKCSGNIIPLMPLVLETHFVSSMNGEGISNLRKLLHRIGCGNFRTTLPSLQNIAVEIPTVYAQIATLIRQMRHRLQSVHGDGEQKSFYTLAELKERVRRPLKTLDVTGMDFHAALKYLHEMGLLVMHDSGWGDSRERYLVSVNPQIIGYLLQRTLRAAQVANDMDSLSGFLPSMHPVMIWGVDQVWSMEQSTSGITATQLMEFLTSLDICCPVVPGACLLPSVLPKIPPPGTCLELNNMVPKRVYLLGYLPSFFPAHLTCRILQALANCNILSRGTPLYPQSPSSPSPRAEVPIITPSGAVLYLWKDHFFLEDKDHSKLFIKILQGGALGPDSTPLCGRVDVLVEANKMKEAFLLHIVTTEIDKLLNERYPCLLDSTYTPQQVEVFIPLMEEWFHVLSASPPPSEHSSEAASDRSSYSSDVFPSSVHGTLKEAIQSIKTTGSLPYAARYGVKPSRSGSGAHSDDADWEVINQGPTQGKNSPKDVTPSPQYLVPVWECLQEVYKPPTQQVKEGSLNFQEVMPDLLFGDLDSSLLIPVPEHYVVKHEERATFLRRYYNEGTLETLECKPIGAERMFTLKRYIQKLRDDLELLRSLSSQHLIAALGVNFSPPLLAVELAPLGTLRDYLNTGKCLENIATHHLALQVLSGMEYLSDRKVLYHYLTTSSVCLWSLEPVKIKLSDSGITHVKGSCEACAVLATATSPFLIKSKAKRLNWIMFGLLLYEIAMKKKAYEGVLSLPTVITGLYYQKLHLNLEAELEHLHMIGKENASVITACHRLCMQSIVNLCVSMEDVSYNLLQTKLSLCAGGFTWGPRKLNLDVECMIPSADGSLVYWASGSRGLVVGNMEPNREGKLYSHILAENPTPESGLFANRRGRPVPIYVGHATAVALSNAQNKLWVGTENGLMGSVYVFDLPDMKSHHYIHLQDAVLSLKVVNECDGEEMKHRALVGLANGSIILFYGMHQGRVLDNPLHGPRKVIVSKDKRPCLSIELSRDSHVWCSCGNGLEIFDLSTLQNVRRHSCFHQEKPIEEKREVVKKIKGDVITLMVIGRRGVWTVARRSSVLRLWDTSSGKLIASLDINIIIRSGHEDISALAVQRGAVWLGTRTGHLLLLDGALFEQQQDCLRGHQFCGEGRVKSIVPIGPKSSLRVLCSLEYSDEISSSLTCWEHTSTEQRSPSR